MRALLPFALLGLFILAAVAMVKLKPEAPEEIERVQETVVKVIPLERADRTIYIDSQGVVESLNTSLLAAETSGSVRNLHPDFLNGNILQKGTELVALDKSDYQIRVSQAEAEVLRAQAVYLQEEAQAEVARREWEKISNQQPTDLALRKPQRLQAKAALSAAKASLRGAQKDLQDTRIVLPFDALIVNRQVNLGAYVNVGAPVATVKDISVAEVVLPVISDYLQFFNSDPSGEPVTLITNQNHRYDAVISRVEGMVDEASRMVNLVARIADPYAFNTTDTSRKALTFGTYVQAKIKASALIQSVQVPRSAVHDRLSLLDESSGAAEAFNENSMNYEVYVARASNRDVPEDEQTTATHSLHIIPVSLLYSSDGTSSVKGAFEPDDMVVISNVDIAVEGTPLILDR